MTQVCHTNKHKGKTKQGSHIEFSFFEADLSGNYLPFNITDSIRDTLATSRGTSNICPSLLCSLTVPPHSEPLLLTLLVAIMSETHGGYE